MLDDWSLHGQDRMEDLEYALQIASEAAAEESYEDLRLRRALEPGWNHRGGATRSASMAQPVPCSSGGAARL